MIKKVGDVFVAMLILITLAILVPGVTTVTTVSVKRTTTVVMTGVPTKSHVYPGDLEETSCRTIPVITGPLKWTVDTPVVRPIFTLGHLISTVIAAAWSGNKTHLIRSTVDDCVAS